MNNFNQTPSQSFVEYVKKMVKEKDNREVSYEEAREAANNLLGFFHLLYKIDQRENITKNDTI